MAEINFNGNGPVTEGEEVVLTWTVGKATITLRKAPGDQEVEYLQAKMQLTALYGEPNDR